MPGRSNRRSGASTISSGECNDNRTDSQVFGNGLLYRCRAERNYGHVVMEHGPPAPSHHPPQPDGYQHRRWRHESQNRSGPTEMKRKHIPLIEIAASALADKLTSVERAELVATKAPAAAVLRMFTPDHIALHCWGGSDKWWNLDMRRRGPELKPRTGPTPRARRSLYASRVIGKSSFIIYTPARSHPSANHAGHRGHFRKG